MRDSLQLKKRFMLTASLLSVISLAMLIYLLWPGANGPSVAALQEQQKNLRHQVEIWRSSNPEKTREDLNTLYAEDVPTRISQISLQVGKLIQETGVNEDTITYPSENTEKAALPNVQQVKIETMVTGDYTKVAKFINRLEQDKLLFIIEKISLTSHEGGTVSLQITFNTFLKTA